MGVKEVYVPRLGECIDATSERHIYQVIVDRVVNQPCCIPGWVSTVN